MKTQPAMSGGRTRSTAAGRTGASGADQGVRPTLTAGSTGWWLLVPVATCLAVHWRGLNAWFRADDFAWLGLAARVHNWRDLPAVLFAPVAQGAIRPAVSAFFLAGYSLFGLDALPFHLAIFAVQCANLALAVRIGQRLSGSLAAGVWGAVLWSIAAVLVEPLGWTCVGDQVFWGFCVLLAFYFLLRFVETGRSRYEIAQWVAFAAGFFVLETNVAYAALAALYTWLCARRYSRRTLPMLAVSAAYAAAHLAAAPLPKTGEYTLHLTGSMLHTLLTYVAWSAGPTAWWTPYHAAPWLLNAAAAAMVLALAGFAIRRPAAWFCLAWFALAIAPVLPLRDHLTEYYPFVPLLGLCWLGGWALVAGWRRGGPARAAAVALALLYAGLQLPRTLAADAWNYRLGARVRDLVEGLQGARERHPHEAILLDGVDAELFDNAIADDPFRLLGYQVRLTPGAGASPEFVLPAAIAARAIERHEAVVYDVRGERLRNITAEYAAGIPASVAPSRLDMTTPLTAYLLGPEWYGPEGDHRWMPGRATLRVAGPRQEGAKLYLVGYCPDGQLQAGPLTVTASADGILLGAQTIDRGHSLVELAFALPPSLVGRPEIGVELAVNRTLRPPGDGRELGLAVGSVEVR